MQEISSKIIYYSVSIIYYFSGKVTLFQTQCNKKRKKIQEISFLQRFPIVFRNSGRLTNRELHTICKMGKKLYTTYKSARYGSCTYALILDKRHPKRNRETFPVAMRYTMDRRSCYNYVSGELTEEEFSRVCTLRTKAVRSKLYEKKMAFDAIFKAQTEMIERMGNSLSLERVKSVATGVGSTKETSFIGIWEKKINFYLTDNNGERCTTAESYVYALKSFRKIMWNRPVAGFNVGKEDIEYWNNGMMHGVKDKAGNIVGKVSNTTRGIYLRSCRAVWNECISMGYLTDQEYPFSNIRKKKLVCIPVGESRKHCYLTVEQMAGLYRVFIERHYPDAWKSGYAERAHYSLGLFLAQYLCNGFNLADAGELTYSQYYFDTGRKAFKFKRVKTSNRTEGGSEVIIPIIRPLQRILDEIAAEPTLNGFVFPDILQGAVLKADKRKRISQENANVQDRILKICQDVLHWEVRPSGTWCRHSYGTNLAHACVEHRYISESMGHSTNHSVTDRYIARYPLETQFEYNSKLLDLEPKITEEDINNMTEEQKTAMLLKLLMRK